jgi:hypothetical protein
VEAIHVGQSDVRALCTARLCFGKKYFFMEAM